MPDTRQKNINMLLGFVGPLGLFLALAGLIVLAVKNSPDIRIAMYITIAVGLLLALLGAGNFIYYFIRATQGVRLYSGMMVIGMVLVALVIVVMANYLASKHSTSWDLTKTSMFSLSDQTISKLTNLNKDVKITYIYYSKDDDFSFVSKILDKYRSYSNRLRVEIINPDRDRDVVYHYEEKFELEQGDKLVVQLGVKNADGEMIWERNQVIMVKDMFESGMSYGASRTFIGEQKLTEAIIKITADREIKIGFTHNNMEPSMDGRGQLEFGDLKYELEREGKVCEIVDIANPVADDISVLVIAAPALPFKFEEMQNLDAYVSRGGSVMVLVRGLSEGEFFNESPLEPWLAKFGVTIKPGFVHDTALRIARGYVLFNQFGSHSVTKAFNSDRHFIVSRIPRVVAELDDKPEGVQISDLISTSEFGAWYEKPVADSTLKVEGKFSIAKALTVKKPTMEKEFRMVVMGDFLIAANDFLKKYGVNKDFVLNCVNWLAEEEVLVEIRPKSPSEAHFTFTEGRLKVVGYFVLLGLPLLCLYAGICVWLIRRK